MRHQAPRSRHPAHHCDAAARYTRSNRHERRPDVYTPMDCPLFFSSDTRPLRE